jgi:hypothetical protein
MLYHHRVHIENELVKFVTAGEQEYDQVIEEYEEEVLIQEEFPEPPVTNTSDSAPAQGKPPCITRILIIKIYIYIYIYIYCVFMLQEFYDDIYTHTPTSLTSHPGRSVLPNRSVRLLGSYANSVPRKISTDRFLKKLGTEQIRYRYFRFGSGTYRNNRTAYNNGVAGSNGSGHLCCLSWRSLLRCSTARRRRRGRVGDGRMAWPLGDGVTVTARARPRRARARSRRPTGEGAVRCRGGRRATAWREGDREPPRHDRAVGEARRTKAQRGGRRAKGSREGGGGAAPA